MVREAAGPVQEGGDYSRSSEARGRKGGGRTRAGGDRARAGADRPRAGADRMGAGADSVGTDSGRTREGGDRPRAVIPLRQRALRLLVAREHSRSELARKLKPHAETPEELQGLLNELEENKQLSNSRYAEARTNVLSRKFGSARIERELRGKGVSDDEAEAAVDAARASDLERARAIWTRKFRAPAATREERAKQMRFLQSRGFSFAVIRAVISGTEDE